jgi:hypothetical protein
MNRIAVRWLHAQSKRLVPQLCEDVPYSDIPAALRARQLLFFRLDDFDAG